MAQCPRMLMKGLNLKSVRVIKLCGSSPIRLRETHSGFITDYPPFEGASNAGLGSIMCSYVVPRLLCPFAESERPGNQVQQDLLRLRARDRRQLVVYGS